MIRLLSLARKLALSLLAATLALALAEGLVRLLVSDPTPQLPATPIVGGEPESDWLPMLVDDLGAPDAQKLYEPDRELFWRLHPDVRLRLENVVYKTGGDPIRWELVTNADGHRGPTSGSHRPGQGPLILCLGDSCTFGFRVDDQQTYPAQLQAVLRLRGQSGATVLNQGVPGYSSHQGRRLLAQLLQRLRPDVVLIAFGANDHEADRHSDAEKSRRSRFLLNRVRQTLNGLALVRWIAGPPSTSRRPPDASADEVRVPPEEFRQNLRAMIRLSRAAGARPLLLDLAFVAPDYRRLILEVAGETGTTWVDGPQILRAGLEQLRPGGTLAQDAAELDRFWTERVTEYRYTYFAPSVYQKMFADPVWSRLLRYLMIEPVHPNRLGHRLIAEAIATELARDRRVGAEK